jgi:bilirubin oxidase
VITSDGGLLDRPVPVTRYLLSVGERIEILVDLTDHTGKSLTLRAFNSALAQNMPGGEPVDFPGLGNRLGKRDFDFLHIDVAAPVAGGIMTIPTTLVANTLIDQATATNTRVVRMTDVPGSPGVPPGFLLDNTPYDMDVINHRIPINTTEIWEIDNQSGFSHPFHIHLVEFNIISRNNGPVPEYEQGWKDVVFVKAHEKARFVARFTDFADATHPYMYHCHIAAHEDEGMMGQFVVDPAPTLVRPDIADDHTLLLYPNPTGGTSTILLPTGRTATSWQVFDPLGRIVAARSTPTENAPLTLPHFTPGIYMLRVTDDRGQSLSTRFTAR